MLTKTKKAKVIKDVRVHDVDTGSADVQIGLLTKRIEELTKHLKKNQKDHSSRRGLLQLVADRQTHMKYLKKVSPTRYKKLMGALDLKVK